ncbi:sulphite reductase hemo protein, beta subunit [Schizopora paradoxa]|uniref:assimilatory sulfite reductase (NADPH) n=1 Tax=Schizopora paradoxa TaxID=27342 RepID=A0A0H2SLM5_9AGAM|nr:sulphite reductase hemo protein, beta subunit [Schizopora paradoxa]
MASKAKSNKATSIVARIAFLCSETVVDYRPASSTEPSFDEEYRILSRRDANGPRLVAVPNADDPGQHAKRLSGKDSLLSLTMSASTKSISQLLPHISEIASSPVVVHIAVDGDLSDVLLLRSSVSFLLHSSTIQQVHDNALTASKIAASERRTVAHIFQVDSQGDLSSDVPDDKIREFMDNKRIPLSAANVKSFLANGGANGHTNGNGHANGFSNGFTNGHPNGNGHSNGHTNGYSNGHANGSGSTGSVSRTPSEFSDPGSPSFHTHDDPTSASLYKAFESASLAVVALVRRAVLPYTCHGPSDAHTVVFVIGQSPAVHADGVKWVHLSLLSPLLPSKILHYVRPGVQRILVLEQLDRWDLKWTPFYLDVVSAVQLLDEPERPVVQSGVLGHPSSISQSDVQNLFKRVLTHHDQQRLRLGKPIARDLGDNLSNASAIPKHESSYSKILSHLFAERLEVVNSPELGNVSSGIASTPEYALGRVRRELEEHAELVCRAREVVQSGDLPEGLHIALSKWLQDKDDSVKSFSASADVLKAIDKLGGVSLAQSPLSIPVLRSQLDMKSRWIIGSDAWSYDLGSSGMHHLIASGLNVNVLIIDSIPYSYRGNVDAARRKRDIGLYAMNHADIYVASVAVFSSYTQVLQALVEADRFNGPSVVLAYLPYTSEDTPALEVLKETKLAVDSGYWPLYRWDPSKERVGKEPFSLDSDAIKQELRDFLDRQNHLSQLTRSTPEFATELVSSLGESVQEARRQRAKLVYDDLVNNISTTPLLILYASDGGAAEKKAKRLANRGKARGLATTVSSMDTVSIDDVANQEYVVFITSVAGQGEFPQNGRTFVKSLNAAVTQSEKPFTQLKFSVFGMGDSHYWPRPEDAHYYNKAGKDLNARLEQLGGERFVELGLGDDQGEDGPETGYKLWEPLIWKALGVDDIEIKEAEPEPITNEHMKIASNYLRGTIAEGLEDITTGALAPTDTQLTKFHGIYQQDDRDIRDERQAQGSEPAYSFMIRVRMPGGVCSPSQWLAIDQIADEHGNGTFKITTRQTFQFHGVIKRHLKPTIQAINRVLLDTLAACGDVNRNVLCSAIPSLSKLHAQVYEFSKGLSEHLLPHTTAYHEIWLDKKMVAGGAIQDFEPLYGEYYLPRKFKVAVAVPPTNDVDVFANDVGFIAIIGKTGELEGFNVTAGGGMGVTHANKKTYPRLGSILGFCTVDQGHKVAEKIMLVQRDNGNRADRKNARLKYTIDRMGLDTFKAEVEKLLGWALAPARPFTFDRNIDDFGWSRGENGKHNFMTFIENGRVQDEPAHDFKTALREIAKVHKGTFRLTANQHIMLADIAPEDLDSIKTLLAKFKLDNINHSGLRLSSSACVAFPTCGLAMAESERYLPILIDKVEAICEENGLRNDSIVMRMTGCPNGCARPYIAEVAFVGKAPGSYVMLLGGGYHGQRLNKIYRESVTEPEILAILRPMIKHYALERLAGEHFGDFVIRAGYIAPTTEGKAWYDQMGGSGQYREISVE